jgi:hypothetical protein
MNIQSTFRKWSLKIFGVLFLVLLVFYIILGLYLDSKHDKILSEVNLFTKENFKGDIAIGDLKVLLFKDFPSLTVELQDVTVKDSLWTIHKKTLIDSEYLYAKIYPWKVIFGNLAVNKVTLKNATLDVHADSTGYSNFSALAKRKVVKKEQTDPILDLQVDNIELKNVVLRGNNALKKKSINVTIKELDAHFSSLSEGFKATVKLNAHIDDLTFNFKNGSFAKNKDLNGPLVVVFEEDKQNISIDSDAFEIGKCLFILNANFGMKENSRFSIGLKSTSVLWKEAASLVSKNIFSKLNKFDFSKPIKVKCDINGDLKDKDFLKIHVIAQIKDNELKAVDQVFTNCSFTGEYSNNYEDNGRYDDANSAVMLHDLKGSFEGISFVTKDLMVLNLKAPIASGSFNADFDAKQLNALFNPDYLNFTKGKVKCRLKFKSDLVNLKISKPFIEGLFSIDQCDYTFVPKNLTFKNNSIDLNFTSDELIVKNFSFETMKSKIQMSGYSKDFMSLYYDSPHKIVLNWEVYSPNLDLIDFIYFLSPSKTKKKVAKTGNKDIFDKLINTQQITAKVKIDRFTHKKFTGTNVIADMELTSKRIILNKLSVKSCEGVLNVNAEIDHGLVDNSFYLKVNADNVDVQKFLYSFNNFGSKSITNNSIRGKLSLQTKLRGKANDGTIKQNSLNGKLAFQLTNGAFVDFKPIENVGKNVFPKRNFQNILVDKLDGAFAIQNGLLSIAPMQINTSVIKMDVEGVFGLQEGTDLNVDVHLRNPDKDKNEISKDVLAENRKKGVCIHLNVIDDKKGGTKIKPRLFKQKSK